MELTEIITIVTIIVTWLLGIVVKKIEWFDNNLIPVQNILIGVIVALIEWTITKEFSTAIALSDLIAGGTYEIFHNLGKIAKKNSDINGVG